MLAKTPRLAQRDDTRVYSRRLRGQQIPPTRNLVLRGPAPSSVYPHTIVIELLPFFLLTLYLAPFMVAAARGHDAIGPILAANLVIGWTGIGWIALLVWAGWTTQARAGAASPVHTQRASSNR